jgi:hypothetical protein
MKFFLSILILLFSCGQHKSSDSPPNVGDLKPQADQIVKTFNIGLIERCDKLTFAALFNAFGGSADLSKFESPEGKWNRDDTAPCYPNDSKSETSLDGYLSVLHLSRSIGDMSIVRRIKDYAEPKHWVTGEGPEGVTSILTLLPLINLMVGAKLDGDENALPYIQGYQAHLAAMWIWLKGRLTGSISDIELGTLQTLWLANLRSPFFRGSLWSIFKSRPNTCNRITSKHAP